MKRKSLQVAKLSQLVMEEIGLIVDDRDLGIEVDGSDIDQRDVRCTREHRKR